jgi:hypothetical protein
MSNSDKHNNDPLPAACSGTRTGGSRAASTCYPHPLRGPARDAVRLNNILSKSSATAVASSEI